MVSLTTGVDIQHCDDRGATSGIHTFDLFGSQPSKASANESNCNTEAMSRRQVQLLTRAGCTICDGVHAQLKQLAGELDFDLSTTDVDAEAAKGDSALRAEFGDRLPVVLLDGREHSYWELDEPRLRKDLASG
jgi:hypothetical protein